MQIGLKQNLKFSGALTNIYLSLMMFLLPLVFNRGYYNISESKSLFFLITSISFIIICSITLLFTLAKYKHINLNFIPTDLAVILFATVNLLSSLLSSYSSDSWLGKNSRLQGSIIILIYAIVYFLVSNTQSSKNVFTPFLVLSFCIVSVVAVFNSFGVDPLGIADELNEKHKATFISTIGNINFFSAYVCLVLPFIVTLYCNTTDKAKSYHYLTGIILGSFSLVLTSSDSFVAGFAVFLLVFPFFCFGDSLKFSNLLKSIAIIIFSASVFSYILKLAPSSIYEPAESLKIILHPVSAVSLTAICLLLKFFIDKKPTILLQFKKIYIILIIVGISALAFMFFYANLKSLGALDEFFKITNSWGNYRGYIYKLSFKILGNFSFKDWLIGIGPETFKNALKTIDISRLDQAHNEYLQFLITTGIFGLLFYLSIIFSVCFLVVKKMNSNPLTLALFMGFVAYIAQAFFNVAQAFTTPLFYLFIAIIVGIYKNNFFQRGKTTEMNAEFKHNLKKFFVSFLASALFLISLSGASIALAEEISSLAEDCLSALESEEDYMQITPNNAPIITNLTEDTIEVEAVPDYEYSIDGINWQTSNVFTNFSKNTVIHIYKREIGSDLMSEASKCMIVSAPEVLVGFDSIQVKPIEGFEYCLDNGDWQQSNVFNQNIVFGKTYTVYQKPINTDGISVLYNKSGTTVTVKENEKTDEYNASHLTWLKKILLLDSNVKDIAADINSDGLVDIRDLVRLKRILSNIN